MSSVRCIFILISALVPVLHVAQAADSGEDAAKTLKSKTVLLRQMYAGDNLSFDPQGNAIGKTTTDPFYLSAIRIEKIHLSNSQVEFKGHRQVMFFQLKADAQSSADIQFLRLHSTNIVIQRDKAHPEALNAALQQIFALSIDEALADKTPDEKHSLLKTVASLQPPVSTTTSQAGIKKVGGDVTPPKLTHFVDPEFPDKARGEKFGSMCIVDMVVNEIGQPIHLRLQQSSGMVEMDENAIKAVSQYKFEPSIYQGKSVSVEVKVEVNFRIY